MELTIPAAAERAARDFGDAPALAEPGGPRLSWRELHEQASVVARAFMAGGQVTELGSHAELIAAGGSYAALWRSWHGSSASPLAPGPP